MNLRKLLCTVVATLVAVSAFATTNLRAKMLSNPMLVFTQAKSFQDGYAVSGKYPQLSQLEYLINGNLLSFESWPLLMPVPQEYDGLVAAAETLRQKLLQERESLFATDDPEVVTAIIKNELMKLVDIKNLPEGQLPNLADPNFIVSLGAATVNRYPMLSPLEYQINQNFYPWEVMPLMTPISPELENTITAATALRAGLLNYTQALTRNNDLTGENKRIDELLREATRLFNSINVEIEKSHASLFEGQKTRDKKLEKAIQAAEETDGKLTLDQDLNQLEKYVLIIYLLNQAVLANQQVVNIYSTDILFTQTSTLFLETFLRKKAATDPWVNPQIRTLLQEQIGQDIIKAFQQAE